MPQPKSSPVVWICAVLVAVTLAAFWSVHQNDFVNYDDPDYVTENQHVRKGLTAESVAWAFRANHASNWHPLTWISHMLDWQWHGERAAGHHRANLFLHAANVALLFLILRKMTGAVWRSAFVAAVFALHPLRVESVAWVSERKDLLSTFFWLLTMFAYARYVESIRPGTRPALLQGSPKWYGIALAFFACGLMSKPMVVTLPCVLLLLDAWPYRRLAGMDWLVGPGTAKPGARPLGQLFQEKLPFFALTVVLCFVTVWAQKTGGSVRSLAEFPLLLRIENAFVAYVRYIGKMFVPVDIAVFYPHPEAWAAWQIFGSVALLAALTYGAWRLRKAAPYFALGWFWFLGTAVPVIGIVQVGIQSMADRYTYVPMIGLYIAMAWGVNALVGRISRSPAADGDRPRAGKVQAPAPGLSGAQMGAAAVAVAVLAGCFFLTRQQVTVWRNGETLFRSALQVTTNNYTAHENLGIVLAAQSKQARAEGNEAVAVAKLEEAKQHFEAGKKIYPLIAESHHNLGNALVGLGALDQARTNYLEAIRLNPNYDSAYMNLGIISVRTGDLESARGYYSKVVELKPQDIVGHYNLATAFLELGNMAGAVKHYTTALQLEPRHVPSMFQLGIVAAREGKRDDAARQFQQVLSFQPDHAGAREQMAQLGR